MNLDVMKIAGALLLGAAALVALLLVVSPTHVTLLGIEGSCRIPLFTAFQETVSRANDFGVAEQCRQQSVVRVVQAGAVLLTVGLLGASLLAFAPSGAAQRRQQLQEWQAWKYEQEKPRQWALYQQQLAEWERENGPSSPETLGASGHAFREHCRRAQESPRRVIRARCGHRRLRGRAGPNGSKQALDRRSPGVDGCGWCSAWKLPPPRLFGQRRTQPGSPGDN